MFQTTNQHLYTMNIFMKTIQKKKWKVKGVNCLRFCTHEAGHSIYQRQEIMRETSSLPRGFPKSPGPSHPNVTSRRIPVTYRA